ncbi:hypothetical protein ISN45_Aa02g012690 [Arabidopsis thaliana x Arabidopsis arenosa]|uniref:KIB1-4 beta-propeller domain-containing protein n=1 Tax=Arabidopsis thaliana x Arabidopsis arenosa TaxID=1240361 RepID=A0A8T2BHK2_9BRAS|nr:hypothetical protein ISN45_Aa02g012690 [Arabidopsis thaliana x Arabidopsis arenosa]
MVDWSNLPEDLLNLIAGRLFSVIELKRFRSICRSWRSSVPGAGNNNPFRSRPLIHLNPYPKKPLINRRQRGEFLSRSAFFRVTLSSSPSQGWLIKSDVDINSGKFHLLDPLSRLPLRHSCASVDLLEFTITEIREAYEVHDWRTRRETRPRFKRVVLVKDKEGDNQVLGIRCTGKMKYWKIKTWKSKKKSYEFSDIIVHKGRLTYALDSIGIVYWIRSDLKVIRFGPPVGDNITNGCSGERSLVECSGELYIVDRLEENSRKRKADTVYADAKTVCFKVYKFDDEQGKMIEVKSLGDKAFVMATDTCFSVLAHEFYGCLQNSIYFTEDKEIKVFKLDNGNGSSIETMSKFPQSCFQMFVPSFL